MLYKCFIRFIIIILSILSIVILILSISQDINTEYKVIDFSDNVYIIKGIDLYKVQFRARIDNKIILIKSFEVINNG